ncbi:MAG: type I methionyl aminopeptidase [Ornithinimicrobium sp.]
MSIFRRRPIPAKTPDQILAMRKAGLVVARTLESSVRFATAGVTTADIDRQAEDSIRSTGATPSFQGYHGFPASLCISVNEEVVHGIPGSRVLAEGDLVSIDCGAIVDGWHGDAAVTLIVGGPHGAAPRPADVAVMNDTQQAMWAGIGALQPGRRLYAVGEAIQASIEHAQRQRERDGLTVRYGIVEDYVGHGIGTSMHMAPHVPNYAVQGKGPMVCDGATLAIEPMVTLGTIETKTLADDWTVITTDGSRAAHWEHTVAVTTRGLWVLTASDGGEQALAAAGATYGPLV